ncbi:MAG: hypothetical protein L0L24_08050 [Enterobacterales bacterium]|nr:hypothetical protein [Enterobacterales bacterium]
MQDSMRDPNSPDFGRRRLITALALSPFLLPLSVQASARPVRHIPISSVLWRSNGCRLSFC